MAGEDQSFRRRGVSGRRHHRRLPPPGAAARSGQDGARQRRRRRRGDSRAADALRRDQRQVRRGAVARGDGQGAGRAGQGPGSDRGGQRLGPRLAARARDGRAAAAAARRRRHDALGRRAPPRRAVPAAAASRRTCCCSTSRRTTSTPSRSRGSSASSRTIRAPSSRSRTIATSSTTSPAGSSSSIAAPGIPWEGNYSSWLEQKQKRLAVEEKTESKRQRTLQRELDWIRLSPRARQAKGKARLNAYEDLLARGDGAEDRAGRDLHPAGPAARRHRRRGARPAARATAICC